MFHDLYQTSEIAGVEGVSDLGSALEIEEEEMDTLEKEFSKM